MKGKSKRTLNRWIWESYLRTAILPLIFLQLTVIVVLYFTSYTTQQNMVDTLYERATIELKNISYGTAEQVSKQLEGITQLTELYAVEVEEAYHNEPILSPEDEGRFAYTDYGGYVTTRDNVNGGAALYYSGYFDIAEPEIDKVAQMFTTQYFMKGLTDSFYLVAQTYYNTWDSLNIIYPYFDTASQYPEKMNIPAYNFYYEADLEHNPTKEVVWTDVYLDPAGQGWITSVIAPVYVDDFLEGVVGLDIKVQEAINQVLDVFIPYSGYTLIIGSDGNILAMPEAGELDWGLDELTDHDYQTAIMEDTFKPDDFNVFLREDLGEFSNKISQNLDGISEITLNGDEKFVSWNTIPETDWKVAIVVSQSNVFSSVDDLNTRLTTIGLGFTFILALFAAGFLYRLNVRAKSMSAEIARPLVKLNRSADLIGQGQFYQEAPDYDVLEFQDTMDSLIHMGQVLGDANTKIMEAQTELQNREAYLEAIIDSIDDFMVEITPDGSITRVWSNVENDFIKKYNQTGHISLEEIVGEKRKKEYIEKIKRVIESGESVVVEFDIINNQQKHWYQARISKIEASTPTALITARDLTNRMMMEKSIIQAKNEAENANRAKSQFLSNMSHELRTPLNAVLGFSQIIESDPNAPLTEEQQDSVTQIRKAGEHLLSLINEILDLARVESGKMDLHIEPHSVLEVMDDTNALMKPVAMNRNIEIKYTKPDETLYFNTDMTRVKQVLINLLSNAVKYNRENGKIEFYATHDKNYIEFHVIDTGEGIPEEALDKIYDPFYRINQKDRLVEGTGIGLSVAKQLIEQMSGEMNVTSEVGVGTHFWITFPLTDQRKQIVETSLENQELLYNENQQARIIYVEDNENNRKLIERMFSQYPGVELITTDTGEAGYVLMEEFKPDLMILDINLPGMSGYELLDKIRSHPNFKDIPVIALTASGMPEDVLSGLKAGFSHYIVKPIVIKELIALVLSSLQDQ